MFKAKAIALLLILPAISCAVVYDAVLLNAGETYEIVLGDTPCTLCHFQILNSFDTIRVKILMKEESIWSPTNGTILEKSCFGPCRYIEFRPSTKTTHKLVITNGGGLPSICKYVVGNCTLKKEITKELTIYSITDLFGIFG